MRGVRTLVVYFVGKMKGGDYNFTMNLFKIFSRWLSIQIRRVMLAICPKKTYQGFTPYATEDEEKFFDLAAKALGKIESVDARRYKRVKQYINSIAYAKSGEDAYIKELRSFFVDTIQQNIEDFACSIVHEATHGYLLSKGFPYEEATAERHERICVKEQISFYKMVTATKGLSDKEKEAEIECYRNTCNSLLKGRWWDSKIQREKGINLFKSYFFKKYIRQQHDANDHLLFECPVINGKKNGNFKQYYEDGTIAVEGVYVSDLMEGLIKEYYPSGRLKAEWCSLKDKMEGKSKSFFENGTLKDDGKYKDGRAHGIHRYFREDGSLIMEATFENGDIVGEVKKY